MRKAPRGQGTGVRQRRWLVGAAFVVVACRLPSFLRPLWDSDEAQYASIAALMNAGGRLYGDGGVDNKFPGIFWTYAVVFRLCGRYAMWAVHLLTLAVVLLTGALLFDIARRLVAERAGRAEGASPGDRAAPESLARTDGSALRAGALAAIFYGVFTTVYYPKMLAANTEIFMMLPLVASMRLLLAARGAARWRALGWSGALVGAACAWKQVALVNLPLGIACAWFFGRGLRRSRDAAAVVLGCGLALGALFALVGRTGSLDGMWHFAVLRLVSHYGPSAWRGPELARAVAAGLLPFVACAALIFVAGGAAALRLRQATGAERGVIGWAAVSGLGVMAGGRFFGHYFIQLVGPLAVLAALEVDRRLSEAAPLARRRLARAVGAATALPAMVFLAVAVTWDPIAEQFGRGGADFASVAAWIDQNSAPDDRLFVWGMAPPLYLLSDRLPASRFVGFLRGLDRRRGEPADHAWDASAEVWPLLARDLVAHPPRIIVDTSTTTRYFDFAAYPLAGFPVLRDLVRRDYVEAAVIDGVTLYRRR